MERFMHCEYGSPQFSCKVAVKMVDKVETPVAAIKREAEMMRNLVHQNIVKCHQACMRHVGH
eukprot:395026-Amphidinium_carterae.1